MAEKAAWPPCGEACGVEPRDRTGAQPQRVRAARARQCGPARGGAYRGARGGQVYERFWNCEAIKLSCPRLRFGEAIKHVKHVKRRVKQLCALLIHGGHLPPLELHS